MLLLVTFSGLAQEESVTGIFQTLRTADYLEHSQTPPAAVTQNFTAETVAADCTTNQCIFLPVLELAPKFYDAQVLHKNSCSSEYTRTFYSGGDTINLKKGVREFAIGGFAAGYQGSRYETYFVINGQERRDIATSGIIGTNNFGFGTQTLIFGPPGTTSCNAEFSAGRSYQAHILIDGMLVQILTVNIID